MRSKDPESVWGGTIKLAMAVSETTMTIMGAISPADTAVSPITKAPTILMAEPTARGRRTPASRRISKTIIIINASNRAGKGTPSWPAAMAISSSVGISS